MDRQKQPVSHGSHSPSRLTVWEQLHLVALLLFLLGKAAVEYIGDLLSKKDFRSKTLRRMVIKNVARNVSRISLKQARSLQKPTGITISNLCSSVNLKHDSIVVNAGNFPSATLHFIDCSIKHENDILLYFHGGGYVYPMSSGNFKFARMAAQGAGSGLVMLEYTLAPELKYPGQLAQAAAALRFLLQSHSASQITIGGDSGGGNLTLAVLSHLRRPHPRIEPIFPAGHEQPLRGALCISPRCSNVCTSASYRYNASKDIVGHESMRLFTSNWQPVFEEVWATPIHGDNSFWKVVIAHRVLLAAGEDEVYIDDIRRLAELMGAERQLGAKVQLAEARDEIHVQCILDLALGIKDGIMLNAVLEWLQSL